MKREREIEREHMYFMESERERERAKESCRHQNTLYVLLYTATPYLMHLLRKPAKAAA
jgi:hypothetical protein